MAQQSYKLTKRNLLLTKDKFNTVNPECCKMVTVDITLLYSHNKPLLNGQQDPVVQSMGNIYPPFEELGLGMVRGVLRLKAIFLSLIIIWYM